MAVWRARIRCSLVAAGIAAAATSAGSAREITPESAAGCFGRSVCEVAGIRLAAFGGDNRPARLVLQVDAERGGAGIGVDHDPGNGFNDAEIQGSVGGAGGEALEVRFPGQRRVEAIAFAHLFNPDLIPDDPVETAVVVAYAGGEAIARIAVTSVGEGFEIDGDAALAHDPGAPGVVRVLEPFGALEPDRLVFTAPGVEGGDSADYSVAAIRVAPAP